ncbi:DUF202 domain-containing protein [Homoserinimonas sp. OAct 916]|uniref:DUF202 domain-containing protein n=1 Tax=Homoserinimonas sp. OAct 916 TaxID=2211450 RepID=UPI000DBE9457|nr:DUF202 domain-containing protein [Homoserinimonas sp. OAct 916]
MNVRRRLAPRSRSQAREPFDSGLQAERTLLSWQRTALALGVGCAVAVRFTAPLFGVAAIVVGIVGVGLVVAGYLQTHHRYRRTQHALHESETLAGIRPWPLAALAAATLLLGVLAVFFLIGGIRVMP